MTCSNLHQIQGLVYSVIVKVRVVVKRTVAGDWCFDNLNGKSSSESTTNTPRLKPLTIQSLVWGGGWGGGGGGGGGSPIWKGQGCSSEILNLTPKRDQTGCSQSLCRLLKETLFI